MPRDLYSTSDVHPKQLGPWPPIVSSIPIYSPSSQAGNTIPQVQSPPTDSTFESARFLTPKNIINRDPKGVWIREVGECTISSEDTPSHASNTNVNRCRDDSFLTLRSNVIKCLFHLLFHTNPFINGIGDDGFPIIIRRYDFSSYVAEASLQGCWIISNEFSCWRWRVVDGWLPSSMGERTVLKKEYLCWFSFRHGSGGQCGKAGACEEKCVCSCALRSIGGIGGGFIL
jgi:hypothetical protein